MKNFLTIVLVGIAMLSTGCGTAKSSSSSSASSPWVGTFNGTITWAVGQNSNGVNMTVTAQGSSGGYQLTGTSSGVPFTGGFTVPTGQIQTTNLTITTTGSTPESLIPSGASFTSDGIVGNGSSLTYFTPNNIDEGVLTQQ